MAAIERALARADRRIDGLLRRVAEEVRTARVAASVSQAALGAQAGVARSQVARIEASQAPWLSLRDATRLAAVLGLDLSVRLYPNGDPPRDAAHGARLDRVLQDVAPPLRTRREVPLPALPDRVELRAWDAVISGADERTALELEMRLHDTQALERRIALKRRDDPTDHFVLVIADTKGNRRILAASATLFADLPRLGPSRVIKALQAGEHPPSCLIVL